MNDPEFNEYYAMRQILKCQAAENLTLKERLETLRVKMEILERKLREAGVA